MMRASDYVRIGLGGLGLWSGLAVGQAEVKSIYMIGNSLTWDSLPVAQMELSRLLPQAGLPASEVDVGWHIRGATSLPYIIENPSDLWASRGPFIDPSWQGRGVGKWSDVLPVFSPDIVTVQPFWSHQKTFADEVAAFVEMTSMMPNGGRDTRFYVWTGWAGVNDQTFESWLEPLEVTESTPITRERRAYHMAVLEAYRAQTGLEVYWAPVQEVLLRVIERVQQTPYTIASGKVFDSSSDFFRDNTHMDGSIGRYLASVTALTAWTGMNLTDLDLFPGPDADSNGRFNSAGAPLDANLSLLIRRTAWEVLSRDPLVGLVDQAPCAMSDLSPTPVGSTVYGQLDGNDIRAFIDSFLAGRPMSDLSSTPPGGPRYGQHDGNDIGAFVSGFLTGCLPAD